MPPPEVLDRLACPRCGAIQYRNAKPCAGVLLEREGKVLLARRGIEPRLGAWDVVGGFVKPHELPAETARRETLEETGLDVQLGELFGMYLDRYGDDEGDDITLNLYYLATAPAGEPVAASDVAELRWFGPDELPEVLAFEHERHLLAAWRSDRQS